MRPVSFDGSPSARERIDAWNEAPQWAEEAQGGLSNRHAVWLINGFA